MRGQGWGVVVPVVFLALLFEASAEPLTVEDAIRIAQAQAKDAIQARQNLLLADVDKMRARAPILPSLDLSSQATASRFVTPFQNTPQCFNADGTPAPNPLVALATGGKCNTVETEGSSYGLNQFQLGLRANQLVFDGGRWWTVIARADDLESQKKAALRQVQNDVRQGVTHRFYDLEKASRAVETLGGQVKLDEDQTDRARRLLQAGLGRQADVAAVERNLSQDRITLARNGQTERIARRALNLALGRPGDTAVTLVVPSELTAENAELAIIGLPQRNELLEIAQAHRAELDQSRFGLEISRKQVSIARADYYPVIAVGGNYLRTARQADRVFSDPTQHFIASVTLGMTWKVFEGRATDANVQQAEIELAKAEVGHADLTRLILGDVDDKLESFSLLIEVYRLARLSYASAQEAVRLAKGLYEQGRGTLLELRDAEVRLTLARLEVINDRLDLEVAREDLRHAVGIDIFDKNAVSPSERRSAVTGGSPLELGAP